jgi:hypothetical protein
MAKKDEKVVVWFSCGAARALHYENLCNELLEALEGVESFLSNNNLGEGSSFVVASIRETIAKSRKAS